MPDLCVYMRDVFFGVSVFYFCRMCSGSSLHVECIIVIAFWDFVFVCVENDVVCEMLFAVCISGGG